jgi:hypothetical protein
VIADDAVSGRRTVVQRLGRPSPFEMLAIVAPLMPVLRA